jgi:hypothetical protein
VKNSAETGAGVRKLAFESAQKTVERGERTFLHVDLVAFLASRPGRDLNP